MPFLRQLYKQKPSAWGPVSAVQASMFKNAEKIGIDPASIADIFPCWSPNSLLSYLNNKFLSFGSGTSFVNNGIKSDGTSNGRCLLANYSAIKTSDGTGYGAFTIMLVANRVDTERRVLLSNRIAHQNKHWEIRLNSDAIGNLKSGNISFLTGDAAKTSGVSGASKIPAPRDATWVFHRKGGVMTIVENGKILASSGDIVRDVYDVAQSLALHGLPDNTLLPNNGSVYLIALFNVELSNSQIAYLSDNPYFLLHRVPTVFYSVPGGTPPTFNPLFLNAAQPTRVIQ